MSRVVDLVDVTLRDGLQDAGVLVDTGSKLDMVEAITRAGLHELEVTSFVRKEWVPALADADELVPRLPMGPRYSALALNMRGWERAVVAFENAGIRGGEYDLVFVTSASERHVHSNNNCSIDQTLLAFEEMGAASRAAGITLKATIACAFGSPWRDEAWCPSDVSGIALRLAGSGARIITLADTVGRAGPDAITAVIAEVDKSVSATPLALHLHDAHGLVLANVAAGLAAGIRIFEGALAGLGGCPFAPGAPGNIDLIRLARFLRERDFDTVADIEGLIAATVVTQTALSKATPIEGTGMHS